MDTKEKETETIILSQEEISNLSFLKQKENLINQKRSLILDCVCNIHKLKKKLKALKKELLVEETEFEKIDIQINNHLLRTYGNYEFVGENEIKKVGN